MNVGQIFDVKMSIQNANNLAAVSAWLTYDPTLVEPVDGDENTDGTQVVAQDLGLIPNATLLANVKKVDGVEEPGTIIVGYGAVPVNPVNANGDAFQIKFKAIAAGTAIFDFVLANTSLLDPNQTEIEADYNPVDLLIENVVIDRATVTLEIV